MTVPRLVARPKAIRRILAGHPWIFRDDLEAPDGGDAGSVRPLYDGAGRFLGQGFFNPASRIAFRLVTRDSRPVDRSFWGRRLETALAYREELGLEGTAGRMVFAEADGFPGLVVDRYGGCLSVQILATGMEKIREEILDLLEERLAPRAIVLRNDTPVRALEGLSPEKGIARGRLPDRVEVREGDCTFRVDLLRGQKTGAYLDQRANRLFLRRFAPGRRVLDAFCYDGWFAVHLAAAGAGEVTALDTSPAALERLAVNAAENGVERIRARRENCFDALKAEGKEGKNYDLVILDPPPFARRKSDTAAALKAYRELHRRALHLVRPRGLLFTCCCSHGVTPDRFAQTLTQAAARAGRRLVLKAQLLQSPDHPILFHQPESLYLKGLLVEVR